MESGIQLETSQCIKTLNKTTVKEKPAKICLVFFIFYFWKDLYD